MEFLVYLIFGGIAGWLASIVMGTDAQQGILMNIVVGVVGAFVGGLIMSAFGQPGVNGFNLYSMFVAVFGAIAFLWLYKMLRYR